MYRFSAFHPLSSFLYFISAFCITMFSRNPVVMAISLFGAFVFLISMRALKGVWVYIILFALTTLTNPIFSHNGVTVLFFLNGNPITLEAIFYGAYLGAMITAVLMWFSCYNIVITSDKFLCLFGRVTPKAALVVSMALRLVPQFITDGKNMLEIHGNLGAEKRGLIEKIKKYVAVFSSLITRSLEGAVEKSASMKARGYGKNKRVNYSRFRIKLSDIALIFLTVFGFIIIVFFCKAMNFNYYPEMDKLSLNPSYILILIYFLIPSAINLWGEIKWRYSVSKI